MILYYSLGAVKLSILNRESVQISEVVLPRVYISSSSLVLTRPSQLVNVTSTFLHVASKKTVRAWGLSYIITVIVY